MLITLIFFSPHATFIVDAEDSQNESVYENLNKEVQSDEEEQVTVAEEQSQTDEHQETRGDSLSVTALDFIKMILAFGFILFLIYFLLKFVTKRNRAFQQGQAILNLGGTNLGQNKSVQIIKVGNRVLVVGVGESITLLKEIDDEKESNDLILDFEKKQEMVVDSKDFIQKIMSLLNQQKNAKKDYSISEATAFTSKLNEQLQIMKEERTKKLKDIKRKGLNKHE